VVAAWWLPTVIACAVGALYVCYSAAQGRAPRRYDELQAKGMAGDYEAILKNVQERDYIDSHREMNPLRQAPDALVLDNSSLTREQQSDWLLARFEEATRGD